MHYEHADAFWLRDSCGIVGAMVGGVATFKQQNAVHGLPLQLSPEEVTLAIEKGWVTLEAPVMDDSLRVRNLQDASTLRQKKRKTRGGYRHDDSDSEDDDEHHAVDVNDVDGNAEAAPTAWQYALANGTALEIPLTPNDALAAERPVGTADQVEERTEDVNSIANQRQTSPEATVSWSFPCTTEERHRYIVFKDLHARGFRLTGGSKFGADYLVYPGDPTVYHAQLCVRLAPPETPILPALLAAACRGSFQARKHLLMASVTEDGTIFYMTFGPVDGFG